MCYHDSMSISELRQAVKARERAATRKVARVERKGVSVRGSEYDPRVSGLDIASMNTRQLNSYMRKLNTFVSRRTQFVAGYKGAPLPSALVKRYQTAERARNERASAHTNGLRDVYIAPSGMTVGQREDMITAANMSILRAGGNPQYRPYDLVQRSMTGIPSADKLKKLTDIAERQTKKDFIRQGLLKQRRNQVAFLTKSGDEGQAKAIQKLTLKQFDILINQTNYRELNSFRYLTADKSGSATLDRITEDSQDEINELISWASQYE